MKWTNQSSIFRSLNILGNAFLVFDYQLWRRYQPKQSTFRRVLNRVATYLIFWTYPPSIEQKFPGKWWLTRQDLPSRSVRGWNKQDTQWRLTRTRNEDSLGYGQQDMGVWGSSGDMDTWRWECLLAAALVHDLLLLDNTIRSRLNLDSGIICRYMSCLLSGAKLGHAGHPGTADQLQLQLNKLIHVSTGDWSP